MPISPHTEQLYYRLREEPHNELSPISFVVNADDKISTLWHAVDVKMHIFEADVREGGFSKKKKKTSLQTNIKLFVSSHVGVCPCVHVLVTETGRQGVT